MENNLGGGRMKSRPLQSCNGLSKSPQAFLEDIEELYLSYSFTKKMLFESMSNKNKYLEKCSKKLPEE